jgi:hypothetical protein
MSATAWARVGAFKTAIGLAADLMHNPHYAEYRSALEDLAWINER